MSRVRGKSDLPESPEKWLCDECGAVSEDYLTAPSPFDPNDTVTGCKTCLAVDSLYVACWKCDKAAGGGYNNSTEYRYVNSCFEHRPRSGNSY